MEKKYIILKSNGCNGFWSYLGKKLERESYITDDLNDRFILTGVEEAVQFDTHEEAVEEIKSFSGQIEKVDKSNTDTLVNNKGAGIYRIEEIFIIPKDI